MAALTRQWEGFAFPKPNQYMKKLTFILSIIAMTGALTAAPRFPFQSGARGPVDACDFFRINEVPGSAITQ